MAKEKRNNQTTTEVENTQIKWTSFTGVELNCINKAVTEDNNWYWKQYAITDLRIAMSILDKVTPFLKDAKTSDWEIYKENWQVVRVFVDWNVDFSTDEKIFLKKQIEAKNWLPIFAQWVFNVLEKIK